MTMITRSASKRPTPAAVTATTSSKRRRRCSTQTSPPDARESPFASLPPDMVRLVGSRLLADGDGDGLLDYVRFRAVCSYWRSCTDSPRGRGVSDARFHPTRWEMLPEPRRGYHRFFNLSTGAVVRLKLPLLRDHSVLGSVDGLLLLQRDHDTAVRLLNPLTGDIADLPPLSTLLQVLSRVQTIHERFKNLETLRNIGATAVRVSPDDGTVIVTVALTMFPMVAFATAGGERWHFATLKYPTSSHHLLSFQGKIYMMLLRPPTSDDQPECNILEIDVNAAAAAGSSSQKKLTTNGRVVVAFWTTPSFRPLHMALVGSEILLVVGSDYGRHELMLGSLAGYMKGKKAWITVRSIGSDKVLLYGPTCLTVSSRALPEIAGDSIVMLDQYRFRVPLLRTAIKSPAADLLRGSVTWPPATWSWQRTIRTYTIYTCNYNPVWEKEPIVYTKDSKWKVQTKFRIRS